MRQETVAIEVSGTHSISSLRFSTLNLGSEILGFNIPMAFFINLSSGFHHGRYGGLNKEFIPEIVPNSSADQR